METDDLLQLTFDALFFFCILVLFLTLVLLPLFSLF